jgi:hypothetical protein
LTRYEALALERIVHHGWPHEHPDRDEERFVRVMLAVPLRVAQWALHRLLCTSIPRATAEAILVEAAKAPPGCSGGAIKGLMGQERLRLS